MDENKYMTMVAHSAALWKTHIDRVGKIDTCSIAAHSFSWSRRNSVAFVLLAAL